MAIVVIQKEKLVPIKPICEALGINDKSQRDKINEDDILSSRARLRCSAPQLEQYQMFCLDLKKMIYKFLY